MFAEQRSNGRKVLTTGRGLGNGTGVVVPGLQVPAFACSGRALVSLRRLTVPPLHPFPLPGRSAVLPTYPAFAFASILKRNCRAVWGLVLRSAALQPRPGRIARLCAFVRVPVLFEFAARLAHRRRRLHSRTKALLAFVCVQGRPDASSLVKVPQCLTGPSQRCACPRKAVPAFAANQPRYSASHRKKQAAEVPFLTNQCARPGRYPFRKLACAPNRAQSITSIRSIRKAVGVPFLAVRCRQLARRGGVSLAFASSLGAWNRSAHAKRAAEVARQRRPQEVAAARKIPMCSLPTSQAEAVREPMASSTPAARHGCIAGLWACVPQTPLPWAICSSRAIKAFGTCRGRRVSFSILCLPCVTPSSLPGRSTLEAGVVTTQAALSRIFLDQVCPPAGAAGGKCGLRPKRRVEVKNERPGSLRSDDRHVQRVFVPP